MKKQLDQIAGCICDKIQKSKKKEGLGLYTGEFGILLFLCYYSDYSKNPKISLLTDLYADELFVRLGNEIRSHTFCDGLSGILYLFDFLKQKQYLTTDIQDIETILENYLIRKMNTDMLNPKYDFMHGALGVGLYFLKKGTNLEPVNELVDFLYNTAEINPVSGTFKWKSVLDIKTGHKGYNISLSHGISSIVLFLARVIRNNSKDEKAFEILNGAINYIRSQKIDVQQYGSHFPNHSSEYSPLYRSRLAWCYGDLGIAFSLWFAGHILHNREWEEEGLRILRDSTKRTSLPDNGIYDAGLCHGTAGIAMIFRRMYLNTQEDVFLQATGYWLEQTLAFATFEDGLAGYKSYRFGQWEHDYYILEGITGVGLTFLSWLTNDRQLWDEIFLLS